MLNKFFPRGLDHSLIFFTAGEAVRRAVGGTRSGIVPGRGSGIVGGVGSGVVRGEGGGVGSGVLIGTGQVGYIPYAEKFGVWQRGLAPMRAALEEIWKPYLDGRGTRDEAFAALIVRTAVEPPKKTNSN